MSQLHYPCALAWGRCFFSSLTAGVAFFPLLIGKVHRDSGALSGIAFYLPVSGKCPEEPLKTIRTMFPPLAQHPGWGSCPGLTPRAATSQNDPKQTLPRCGTTTSNQPCVRNHLNLDAK